ncbi:hypothetical protein CW705_01450 [Candidatus Bathyarchaeota archaeon]|nr:MAG: hypothetical protein CW705_01450 [Candidatus Bathyarchaeota archaeon]
MPRKGFKSITVREEVYNYFWDLWQRNKEEYRKQGITSFSGFVTKLLYEMIEKEKKRLEAD